MNGRWASGLDLVRFVLLVLQIAWAIACSLLGALLAWLASRADIGTTELGWTVAAASGVWFGAVLACVSAMSEQWGSRGAAAAWTRWLAWAASVVLYAAGLACARGSVMGIEEVYVTAAVAGALSVGGLVVNVCGGEMKRIG